ncbi:nose resistant to fluoxetine protein 6-like [Malaya genurostris]|uniref:nose resistant to fluoxetine protein 6-like n=1 Tax=Malaya genurostris TaxID=325434 RepID=UPI0026F3B81A|nr:nose resistant to fluoxetine protein 6-like [Malaya genurostris]
MWQFVWLILGVLHVGLSSSSEIPKSAVIQRMDNIPYSFAIFLGQVRSSNYTIGDSWQNKLCAFDLELFADALQKDTFWALDFFDSWGKTPAGLLHGNYFTPGNFEQCLHLTESNEARSIKSQHCTVQLGLQNSKVLSSALWLGICVPASCEPSFIKQLTEYFALEYELDPVLDYNQTEFCYHQNDGSESFGKATTYAIIVLSVIAAVVVACTIVEILGLLLKQSISKYMKHVSLYNNIVMVLETNTKSDEKTKTLDCVNGIRSILMLQIVAHHVHDAFRTIPVSNHSTREKYFETAPGILSYRVSALSADIFLALSAMLLTTGFMSKLTNNASKTDIVRVWIHRIIRILPAYGFLIFFTIAFAEHFGEGPLYRHLVQPTVDACVDNWWTAMLFVQNYMNPDRLCLPHTWYLSVDMQLYFISPVLIYLLWRYKSLISHNITFLVMIPIVCVFATFTYNDFWLNPPMTGNREMHRLQSTYYATHARMSAWFLGIGFGYFLFQTREKQVKWSAIVLTTVSVFATALSGFIMFAAYEIYKPRGVDLLGDAFYESLHRVAWVGCHMWLIFMCINGYGSVLNSFLSWAVWKPIARLSYCMYLIHYVVIIITFGSTVRQPLYFSVVNMQYILMGVVGISAATSFIWTLFIEQPFVSLERNIFTLFKR